MAGDDLQGHPIGAAELDAVEAFLLPLANAILSDHTAAAGLVPKPGLDLPLPQCPVLEDG